MGHSVGIADMPSAGTIFGFVALFHQETGKREPGNFAIVPHHVATCLDHLVTLKAGDEMLHNLQSPAFSDSGHIIQKIGIEAWEHYQALGAEISKGAKARQEAVSHNFYS